jgi:ribosomal protein S24E
LQVQKKSESKLLGRTYVEVMLPGKAGHITRKDAIAGLAEEMKVGPESVGLVGLWQKSGTTDVVGGFYVYSTQEGAKIHPKHLKVRTLTKEDREKLKQEKKKAKTAPPKTEAKK